MTVTGRSYLRLSSREDSVKVHPDGATSTYSVPLPHRWQRNANFVTLVREQTDLLPPQPVSSIDARH